MRLTFKTLEPATTMGGMPEPKKPYAPPGLREFGELRTLTLGGSPGAGDSGGPMGPPQKFPGG
jgi:hypothetical protein